MKRNIIDIDENKCNGCGLCVNACHEGALQMINGKAKLITDSYCDGLGACLPECPTGAITIEVREADAFDEEAVTIRLKEMSAPGAAVDISDGADAGCASLKIHSGGGCPGSAARAIHQVAEVPDQVPATPVRSVSQLRQWPVQIKLVPVKAPYLENASLLIAADCTAFAYPNIHEDFMKGRVTLIGCPKLDEGDYAEKFTAILKNNNIRSITVLRMEVPCCGGITHAVQRALQQSGKMIPWRMVTISASGEILQDF